MKLTNILLLDDHPIILDGLAAFLDAQGDLKVVARCESAEQAMAALKTTSPDVAIVDVKVQGGFSFEFVQAAKKLLPDLKLVFITGHEDDVFIEKAFQAGALGYVLKNEPLTEVSTAVRSAMKGKRYLSCEVLKRVSVDEGEDVGNQVQTRLSMLTRREREVLHYVSQGSSAKEISEILKISTWTVTNHKANIMAKLDIHNQVGLTRFAVSTGLADLRV